MPQKKTMPLESNIAHIYSLKSAIEDLLGKKAWLELKETTSVKTWQKYFLKIFDAIELSINTTVQIRDDLWLVDVTHNLNHGRELVKSAEDIDTMISGFSATLLRQVFLQLGSSPSRKMSDSISLRAENWNFTGFRSVQYVQSPEQKEALFRLNQRKVIGFDAQINLEAEYRQSGTKKPYSVWCKERGA